MIYMPLLLAAYLAGITLGAVVELTRTDQLAEGNPTDQVDSTDTVAEADDGFAFGEKWQALNVFGGQFKSVARTAELQERTLFTGVFKELDPNRPFNSDRAGDDRREVDLPYEELLMRAAFDSVEAPKEPGVPSVVQRTVLDPDSSEAKMALYEMLKRMAEMETLHSYGAVPKDSKEPATNPTVQQRVRRFIFGADDRTHVANSKNFPYRTVGMVGNHCTGTLIGPRHVLTAGHCVHSGPGGDWISNLNFRPGLNNANGVPPGSKTYKWVKVNSVTAWTLNGEWEADYALITLEESPSVGWMSFGWHTGISSGWNFNINGYPGDKPWGQMFNHFGALIDAKSKQLRHRMDTVPGTSGSGMYVKFDSGLRRIYGVSNVEVSKVVIEWPWFWNWHWEKDYNAGVRVTESRFALICGWMNEPSVC